MEFVFFCFGIIFFQLIFNIFQFITYNSKEYIYYMAFTIIGSASVICRIYPEYDPFQFIPGNQEFPYIALESLFIVLFYYRFIRHFVNTPVKYPIVDRCFQVAEYTILSAVGLIIISEIFAAHKISIILFLAIFFLTLIFNLTLVTYFLIKNSVLERIIALGALFAIISTRSVGPRITMALDAIHDLTRIKALLLGLVIEFFFFTLAIMYKSKITLKEKFKLEVQNQINLSNQRARIIADLHDDVGSSLSSTRLNLQLAVNDLAENNVDIKKIISKTEDELLEVMNNMNDIVWAISQSDQRFISIGSRIKDFYFDLFDSKNIICDYQIDEQLETEIKNISIRKNLLLIAKEAINNILKHANASKIKIELRQQEENLMLQISDNGIGLPLNLESTKGNGRFNMHQRASQMKGELKLESKKGEGTTITCLIPLTNIRYSESTEVI